MPGYWALERQHGRPHVFWISALILVIILLAGSKTLAASLVYTETKIDVGKLTSSPKAVEDAGMEGPSVAAVPELQASLVDRTVTWTAGEILREVGKQAIDQPGHFLIGAAPIWAARHLVGVPWLGWVAAPVITYREWLQWPSNRWWDPPLDWAFFSLGAVAATWSGRPGQKLAGGLGAIWQSLTSGPAVRRRMRPAG